MDRGWAIVTGASGGLGREFVRQISGMGHPLLAVARSDGALEELAVPLRSKGAIIETLSADLATDAGIRLVIAKASSLGPAGAFTPRAVLRRLMSWLFAPVR